MAITPEYRDEWRAAHREHIREYDRKWAAQNREKRAVYDRNMRKKLREQVIEFLGGKCAACGYDDHIMALQVDHINGDGKADRVKGALQSYRNMLKRGCEGVQVLCANCHAIKTWGS